MLLLDHMRYDGVLEVHSQQGHVTAEVSHIKYLQPSSELDARPRDISPDIAHIR
jgi:hypothetical protein